ncbi:MAG: hypothetical protein IBJ10_06340 [Phycisphaerales bacterium]|nr:hypothetical protein [Phycisphaerales bacterium]
MPSVPFRAVCAALLSAYASPGLFAQTDCGAGWSPIPGRPGPVGAFTANPADLGVSPGPILALHVFDPDGPAGAAEPVLWAGGAFISTGAANTSRLARWNGTHWVGGTSSQVTSAVTALFEWDTDGAGSTPPELHALDNAGRLYRWSGTQWATLAGTIPFPANPASDPRCDPSVFVTAAAVFDDDNNGVASLFVAACDTVYKRVGGGWQPVGAPFLSAVYALAAHDDGLGLGTRLYAGGAFAVSTGAVANRVAVLSHQAAPQQWFSLPGQGVNGTVYALHSGPDFDVPGKRSLYVGGAFMSIVQQGNARLIAEWDGIAWSTLGVGLRGGDATVRVIADYDPDGPGPAPAVLAVGGGFAQTHDTLLNVRRVALWDGQSWAALGAGIQAGSNTGSSLGLSSPTVRALAAFDEDQGGPGGVRLYAAGYFGDAGGIATNSIAPWTAAQRLTIASNPVDLTISVGQTAVFAVSIDPIHASPSFQWLRNGQPLEESLRVRGVNGPALALDAVADGDSGMYTCEVSAPGCASAMSAPAFLTVACAGDANLDGQVNFSDLNTVISFFNTVCP